MRPQTEPLRVESTGSVWLLDTDRYMRFPKNDAPREVSEWGSAEAGPLQDFVWHPMKSWRVERVACRLVISLPDTELRVSAPLTVAEVDRLAELLEH